MNKKPKLLFHGTVEKDLKILKPKSDTNESKIIFGTPFIEFATTFVVDSNDSWIKSTKINDRYFIAITDKEKYIQKDKGGSIYILESEKFKLKEDCIDNAEWITEDTVIPLAHINFHKALDTMMQNNVQVYFVNEFIFNEIKIHEKESINIFKNIISENQKIGINPYKFI